MNEKVEDLNEAFGTLTGNFTIVCECGDSTCMERITLTTAEYEALRADPTQFAVRPGHDGPNVETVVARHAEYHVIKKVPGEPSHLAEATDTRTDG